MGRSRGVVPNSHGPRGDEMFKACCMVALVAAATLAGCATPAPEVRSDYETATNFSAFKTYAWMPGLEPPPQVVGMDSAWLDARIRRAVEKELSRRGCQLAPAGSADFLVAYHVALARKLDVAKIEHVYGYAARRGTPVTAELTRAYEEGSLIIDVLGPKDRQLRIEDTVRQILERFPRR